MHPLEHQLLSVNGIQLSLYSAGPATGRPVWLLHGFPECWHSWRQQIAPLTAAGYRVLIPEMRGYGQSSAPRDPAAYDVLTICADIQAAMDQLGQQQVCVVGHDWGAPIAWHLALLEPERINALVTMSVPFAGRSRRPVIEVMRELYAERFNYILYFQQPGVAEQELEADIEPFRGILLGLFFLGVGMAIDLTVIAANWQLVMFADYQGFLLAILPPGAFIVLGLLIACKNRVDEVLAERAKARQVDAPVQSRRVRVTGVIE